MVEDLSVLVVGHISVDLRNNFQFPGGPPQYQVPLLKAFGVKSVDILTSANHIPENLTTSGFNIINIQSQSNSTFEFLKNNEVGEDDRLLLLRSKAEDIQEKDLDLLQSSYDIVIISAIANEISLDILNFILHKYQDSQIIIDGQSFTREISKEGVISNNVITQGFLESLQYSNIIIKASFYEIDDLKKYTFDGILIRTNSGKPIEVLENSNYFIFPVDEVTGSIKDGTGSGDIFLVSFIVKYVQTKEIEQSIVFAHEITKLHLDIQGIPSFDQSIQIIKFVEKLHDL